MVGTGSATYCSSLTPNILTDFRYALKNIGNDGVSVYSQFGLRIE